MKAMTILTRCREAEADARRIRQKIRQRMEAAENVSPAMDPAGSVTHSSSEPDRIASLTCGITALEKELETREQARRAEAAAACVYLDTLSEAESAILYSYYVGYLSTGEIAAKLHYVVGYVRNIKTSAEKKLDTLDDATVRAALPPWYLKAYGDAA